MLNAAIGVKEKMKETKTKKIECRVTAKEFEEITANAAALNLATGTYLRLLGLLGIAPYITRELPGSGRFRNLRVDDVLEISAEKREVLVQKIDQKVGE